MNNCIVTVANVDKGLYQEFRGFNAPIKGLLDLGEYKDEGDGESPMRTIKVWACDARDADAVVEKLSNEWVGSEVKVFTLTKISTRLPGVLKSKEVSKDGVLPV